MSVHSILTIIVSFSVSLAISAVILPIIPFFTWWLSLRKEGESISAVWKILGVKFVIATTLIMSAILMPTGLKITRALFGVESPERQPSESKCTCTCDACKKCDRRNQDDAGR